jgi:nucleoside 2-deoxyribosyltransferase
MSPMRIFYSHAKQLYGTPAEKKQLSLIKEHFPADSVVVDPGIVEGNVEPEKEIQYFLRLVDQCDAVVFSRYRGVVTSGVSQEVNYAMSKGKPVFELRSGARVVQVKEPTRSSKIDALIFVAKDSVQGIFQRS